MTHVRVWGFTARRCMIRHGNVTRICKMRLHPLGKHDLHCACAGGAASHVFSCDGDLKDYNKTYYIIYYD